MKVLLDSVVLIDHFCGVGPATDYLGRIEHEAALSVITRAEVLTGFAGDQLPLATALLDRFPTLPIERPVADLAARLRREHRFNLPDALQAALARDHALELATRNTRDFPPGRFPWIVVPYSLPDAG